MFVKEYILIDAQKVQRVSVRDSDISKAERQSYGTICLQKKKDVLLKIRGHDAALSTPNAQLPAARGCHQCTPCLEFPSEVGRTCMASVTTPKRLEKD